MALVNNGGGLHDESDLLCYESIDHLFAANGLHPRLGALSLTARRHKVRTHQLKGIGLNAVQSSRHATKRVGLERVVANVLVKANSEGAGVGVGRKRHSWRQLKQYFSTHS